MCTADYTVRCSIVVCILENCSKFNNLHEHKQGEIYRALYL